MRFLSGKFFEIGDLPEQARNAFGWNVDGGLLNDIGDILDRNDGHINRSSFASVASDALTLRSDSETVYIPGINSRSDWRDRRFYFTVEVEIESPSRYDPSSVIASVEGYTDRTDLSYGDHLDPHMRMYINSVTTIKVEDNGARGINKYVIDSSQTLLGDLRRGSETLIRPSDIFVTLDTINDPLVDTDDLDDVIDSRNTFTLGGQLNQRTNNSSAGFLESLINADISAADDLLTRDGQYSDTRDTIASETAGGASCSYRANRFLRAMLESDIAVSSSNFFTFRDLADFCNDNVDSIDRACEIQSLTSFIDTESEDLHSGTPDAMAAKEVCHMIPLLMWECRINSVELVADNRRSYDRSADMAISNLTSMLGVRDHPRALINSFHNRFKSEIFNKISNRGYNTVKIEVESYMGGLTIVKIWFESESMYRYVFTGFADALLAPIVTSRSEVSLDLAEGYNDIRKTIDDVTGRRSSTIDISTSVSDARRDRDSDRSGRRRDERSGRSRSLDHLIDGELDDLRNL